MLKILNKNKLLRRYRDNEDGNMAVMFGISVVAIVGLMGAAMDYTTLSNAKSRGQSIADATALSAAIFVKNNDRAPVESGEGYVQGTHSAYDLGYEFKGWVEGGAQNVTVDVFYDDNAKEARVTVSGKTVPTFIQVLGKQNLDFSAVSTVSYLDVDEMHPASIVLVLDNSGSMRWDSDKMTNSGTRPANPSSRMSGLKTSVRTFRDELRGRIGDQQQTDEGVRVLRTGILPYNSAIIPSINDNERQMAWGFAGVEETFINPMVANGGTNSNPPMTEAKRWLTLEDDKHKTEADNRNETYRQPLKFVVFMTDGQNTSGDYQLVPLAGTGYYYKEISNRWYYTRSSWYAGRNGFVEGNLKLDSDDKTIEACQAMQAQGTTIYTIGYALEVGSYYDPLFPSSPGVVTEGTRSTANSLLSACASKPEFFIQAKDGDELEGAFDQIQNSIVKELIRLKS